MDLTTTEPTTPSRRNRPAADGHTGSHSKSHSSQSRKHRKRNRQIRSLKLINLLLALSLIAALIAWINTWVNYNASQDERVALAAELRETNEQFEKLQVESGKLQAKLSALVEQRLPGLREMRFDTTLPIEEGYIRNISFHQTGVGDQKRYEYSLVLENQGREVLKPELRILLFDESGLQTGAATITAKAATANSDLEFLDPKEIRAYTADIPSTLDHPPEYFTIIME